MGQLGLHLIRVVFWASERISRKREHVGDYLLALAGHVAICYVTIVGKVVDWLPLGGTWPRQPLAALPRRHAAR